MGQILNRSRNTPHPAANWNASKRTSFLSYLENLFRIVGALMCCAGRSFAPAALLLLGMGNHAFAGNVGDRQEFELLGTWYIVVHYRDASAAPAGREFWEDKVWTFAYRGSRLQWSEYSAVSFNDDRGRHERLTGGRTIRSSGAWRPSPAQLEEIAAGLSVNPQSLRSKSLRGDPADGFRSTGSIHSTSASVIGYSETWEIEDPGKQPVFRRVDEMSSGRSLAIKGITEYRSAAGSTLALGKLSGSFSRDGAQTGSFVMLRSGPLELANPKKWIKEADREVDREAEKKRNK